MCYLKSVEKADNINEIQAAIMRKIVGKKENFDYQCISDEIKKELKRLGAPKEVVESYKVENMIGDTLEQMVVMKDISFFNNVYIPCKSPLKRVRYMLG